MKMSERIKERRHALGLTQEELATKLGLQKSAIAKYENGRVSNIKRSVISEMSRILDCSPTYLMGFDDPVPSAASVSIEPDEEKLLSSYRKLNKTGKEKALEYISDMTDLEKYTSLEELSISDAG